MGTMVTAYSRSGRLDTAVLVGLLLLATVDRILSQESEPCPEGYAEHRLQRFGDPYFNYILRDNRFNYPEAVWSLGIQGSTNFITMKGKDAYIVKSLSGNTFILKEACVETKQVRTVAFTAVLSDDTEVFDKEKKTTKGSYTESCMEIPPGGLEIRRVLFEFRTTKGAKYKDEEQNYFQVRELTVLGCFPIAPVDAPPELPPP